MTAPTEPACIEERITFASEGLTLEGVLAYPGEGEPVGAALLLSPHPHLGGTMDNNVVRHLAVCAASDGLATLRFNYRGVGVSAIRLEPGETLFAHWEEMEQRLRYDEILPDAQAALDALARAVPAIPVGLVGYSLGAVLAGMLAWDERVEKVLAVAPPVKRVGLTPFADCRKPKVFVVGERDFVFDRDRFDRDYARLHEPKERLYVTDGDHFFRKREPELYALLKPRLTHR